MKKILIIIFASIAAITANAELTLPRLISDNMVLERDTIVNIWGRADANTKVVVSPSWTKQKYTTTAAADSTWLVKVATPAAGGPYCLKITNGSQSKEIKNVLIGEVWFCSGQSNMEMPMRSYDSQPVKGGNEAIAMAKPNVPIHVFSSDYINGDYQLLHSLVPKEDALGAWGEHTPEIVAQTSATAYYFAHYLQKLLDVPVGIIISSRGGAHIEPFMSRESLKNFPEVDIDRVYAPGHQIADTDDATVLYNGRIYPFRNFTVKGVLWYQGEGNVCNAPRYADLLEAFITTDIRALWGNPDMPFYQVEIAPFDGNSPDEYRSALVREAQLDVACRVPHVGIVSTLDNGEDKIIHPSDKDTVGRRLALLALGDTYGLKHFDYLSPRYESMRVEGNRIYLTFTNIAHGLTPMYVDIDGFEVCGSDGIWHKAVGRIGQTPTWQTYFYVTSDDVPEPTGVRYAFHRNPHATVFNTAGLPLHPFRTVRDDYPKE